MDWIIGIQKAIDHIEENLTREIDYEKIAAEGFSSSYHFQRVFHILCGYTIGEYIRMRRLSLAGEELTKSKKKGTIEGKKERGFYDCKRGKTPH